MGKLGPKNQNIQIELKSGAYTNLNMQNSMVVFIFPVLHQKPFFGGHFPHKRNIVSLGGNFYPRLIQISRIQWRCLVFLF